MCFTGQKSSTGMDIIRRSELVRRHLPKKSEQESSVSNVLVQQMTDIVVEDTKTTQCFMDVQSRL